MAKAKAKDMSKEIKENVLKNSAIEEAINNIEKTYGRGTIMRLGGSEQVSIPTISSGSIALDLALGVGGLPRGRVIEIYGPEASGKTTVALHAIAECQRSGGVAAFIDAEHALDVRYARRLGVDIDNLLVSQPDYGEQALEIADILVKSNGIDIVVIDMPLLDTRRGKDLLGTFLSDIVLQLLSFVAENERTNIRQRQAEGIAAAKARGKRFGRSPKPLPPDFDIYYKRWKNGEITGTDAAKACQMPLSSFRYRAKLYEQRGE